VIKSVCAISLDILPQNHENLVRFLQNFFKSSEQRQTPPMAAPSTEIPARTEQPATLKNYFRNNNAGSVQAGVAATFLKIWNASAL
jgi:hypothetical protein